ncbi:MAG: hypothetical protein RIG84_02950 [Roseovarius sp.]
MNVNQMVNMIVRMVMRRAVKTGIDKGINAYADQRDAQTGAGDTKGGQKRKAPDSAETRKRMKQSMRMMRKMGRF